MEALIAEEIKTEGSKPCLICGSRDVNSVGQFYASPGDALYCKYCNSFFPSNFPTEEELAVYYQSFKFNPPPSRRLANCWQRSIFSKKCKKIKKRVPSGDIDLLDFGGGCGLYAQGFSAAGYNVTMVEVDKSAIEVARGLGVRAMTLDEVSETFDIVFSSHVIEHYKDLDLFFSRINALMKPSGKAVVACPNKDSKEFYRVEHVRGYMRKVKSSNLLKFMSNPWWCLDPPRHFYSLSEKTFSVLAERHGFTVVDKFSEFSTQSNFSHNDMYALCRPENVLNPLKLIYKAYVNLLSLFMSIFFRKSMYGDNLVVVLKKR